MDSNQLLTCQAARAQISQMRQELELLQSKKDEAEAGNRLKVLYPQLWGVKCIM